MATENALRDQNRVTTALAVLNTDTVQGTNLVRIRCDADGAMMTTTTDTISFTMVPIDPEDENYVDCMQFEGTDGLTYPWVATADGAVLIDEV